MRISFIRRVQDPRALISKEREDFIRSTYGGSAFLLAGGTFWLSGALLSSLDPALKIPFVIWGGLMVPVLGFAYGRLQGARFLSQSQYTSLAAIAPVLEIAAIPIMIYLQDIRPDALPAIGLGARHRGKPIVLLVADRDVRIVSEDGELLRALVLDPTRDDLIFGDRHKISGET